MGLATPKAQRRELGQNSPFRHDTPYVTPLMVMAMLMIPYGGTTLPHDGSVRIFYFSYFIFYFIKKDTLFSAIKEFALPLRHTACWNGFHLFFLLS